MRDLDPTPSSKRRAFLGTRTAVVFLLILCLSVGAASAGKNDGGAMIVHTDDAIVWTATQPDYCDDYATVAPADCESANTRSGVDRQHAGTVVWFLAAFHLEAEPAVNSIQFGIDHSFPALYLPAWGACGIGEIVEEANTGWPHEPDGAGCTITYAPPIAGEPLFAFYWLAAYGTIGDFLGTGIHPALGYASFLSDDEPAIEDQVTRFGVVRWFAPGENSCPEPPRRGACCLPDGSCLELFEHECQAMPYRGIHSGAGSTCDEACGACCYWRQDFDVITRRCVVTTYDDCMDEESWNAILLEVPQGDPPELVFVGAEWGPPGWTCTHDPEFGDTERYCQDPRDSWTDAPRACCVGEQCFVVTPWVCGHMGGISLPDPTCEGVPCPPDPVEATSWGKIRTGFRGDRE